MTGVQTCALPISAKVEAFRAAERFPLTRFRKGKSATFDIRPLVASLEVGAGKIRLALIQEQGRPGVSPREVLEQVCALAHEDDGNLLCRYWIDL